MMPPGSRLLAFASRWFDPQTVGGVFQPLVADWQREWQDAPQSRRRWVSVRGLAAFACAAFVSTPSVILTPMPPSIAWRLTKRITLFVMAASVLFAPAMPGMDGPWMPILLLALPGGITLAMPFAMIIAVDAIRCHEDLPAHIERAAAVRLAIVVVLFMIVCGGFVVPAANQSWRATMAATYGARHGDALARGVRELTTVELITDPDRVTLTGRPPHDSIRRELNSRAALAVLPVLFIWLRWRALDLPRRRFSPLPASMVAAFAILGFIMLYVTAGFVEDLLRLQAGTGLWLPLAAFTALGLAEQKWRLRSMRQEA